MGHVCFLPKSIWQQQGWASPEPPSPTLLGLGCQVARVLRCFVWRPGPNCLPACSEYEGQTEEGHTGRLDALRSRDRRVKSRRQAVGEEELDQNLKQNLEGRGFG